MIGQLREVLIFTLVFGWIFSGIDTSFLVLYNEFNDDRNK